MANEKNNFSELQYPHMLKKSSISGLPCPNGWILGVSEKASNIVRAMFKS